jgi:hypothetical protein
MTVGKDGMKSGMVPDPPPPTAPPPPPPVLGGRSLSVILTRIEAIVVDALYPMSVEEAVCVMVAEWAPSYAASSVAVIVTV